MLFHKSVIVGQNEITLEIHHADNADVYRRVVNPRTGKGWQAARDLQHFEGCLASMKALSAWNKLQKS